MPLPAFWYEKNIPSLHVVPHWSVGKSRFGARRRSLGCGVELWAMWMITEVSVCCFLRFQKSVDAQVLRYLDLRA